ncbi:DNA-binding MarR family transcriptional regulator [Humitalea rosea]|uniref:DNA-binding MarR family transcriptional regulator n=1 Tax=Humitalea rosea TaxID=990373 RepID=A0A2W7IUE9_9PROT|nr:MarR family winged helix-turn-helix transcriptional regulator [Humitalea rosea]PZW43107.1 DNA-binding MarR family transcriptional regulator [Humitalea rosea]
MACDPSPEPRFIDGYLPYLLARASHAVSSEFHARLKAQGIGVVEWRVLASLSGSSGEAVGTLAAACLMQQPTMTKLIGRMALEGLVERHAEPGDRRIVRVGLTPRGAAIAAELTEAARAHEAELTAAMPDDQAGTMRALLRGLIDRSGA